MGSGLREIPPFPELCHPLTLPLDLGTPRGKRLCWLITLQRQPFEEVSTWKFSATKNLPHAVMGTTLGRILSFFGPHLLCRVEIIPAQGTT